ncbi:MAG: YbjQ family protein [Candidatus Omnitrophica bacterium]|nr:YbjQ family protein [Candidatus Omnitrophota bacterium]
MKTLRLIGSLGFVLGLFTTIFAGVPWLVVVEDDPVIPWWFRIAIFSLLGGILVVLGAVAVEQREARKSAGELPNAGSESRMLLLSSTDIPGRQTSEILGLVKGHTIYAIWLGKDLSALLRLVLGGELTEYTEMIGRARQLATDRMIAQAEELGADAIINVRYMTNSVVGSAAELLAYGTAVKLNK